MRPAAVENVAPPPPAAVAPADHLNLVVVGHVDHGKSTLVGRLLFETGSLAAGQAERIRAACRAEGMEFEYAFFLDALLEEQAQNITLDTTRVTFRTPRRAYTIIDAPGHQEFLKNMVTGAASADAAILLVDAAEGLREQTRRHGFLLSLLGLRQLVVAVNKMDLVQYDFAVFQRIQADLAGFLAQLNLSAAHFVPISARQGEGLLRRSPRTPWYQGPSLLEALATFAATPVPRATALRLTVQDIYRFDGRRLVAGRVEAGALRAGDPIEFSPGGNRSRIKSIEHWPARAPGSGDEAVGAGQAVALTLADELFVERGQIGAPPGAGPQTARTLAARIFWLHPEPLRVDEVLPLRLGTQQAEARILAVPCQLDALTLESRRGSAEVRRHEAAEIHLRVRRPLAFEVGGAAPALGRFVLMRDRRIAGGGVIDRALPDPRQVSSASAPHLRTAILGHRGGIIWLTGLSGAGKSTLARALELRLLHADILATVVDGDSLRTGLSQNLGFSAEDRRENLRRATEVAMHLAHAGAVVITAFISPFRADRAAAAERARTENVPFAEVFINAPLSACERRDPKQLYERARAGLIRDFTGIDSPYEAPAAPDLELRTDRESVEESLERLSALAFGLSRLPDGPPAVS